VKILSLKAENIMRLKAAHINPDGSTVIITGKNRAGKSSVLNAITMALEGGRSIPPKPIHDGAKKAEVVLEMEDLIVTRRFSQKGTYLEVTNGEGLAHKSPQKLLEKLAGKTMDPMAFARMEPKGQLETLKRLVGLDFTELDAERDLAYQKRRDVNRDLKAAEAKLKDAPIHEDAPDEEVLIADLTAELDARREHNRANEGRRSAYANLCVTSGECQDRIDKIKKNIADMEAALKDAEAELKDVEIEKKHAAAQVEGSEDKDEREILDKMAEAEETNRQVRENKTYIELQTQRDELQEQSDKFTTDIGIVDNKKAGMVAAAKMPIDVLGLGDEGVTLNGFPLEQASSAEMLRVSTAIALALGGELKVVLIRDGSLLDEDSMAMVAQLAEDAGGQLWVERVDSDDPAAVLIEDGMVVEQHAEESDAD